MTEFAELSRGEYSEFTKNNQVDWLQSVEFSDFKESRGWINYFLAKIDGEKIIDAVMVSEKGGRFFVEMSGFYDVDFYRFIDNFCGKRRPVSISILPRIVRNIRDNNLEITITNDEISKIDNVFLKMSYTKIASFDKKLVQKTLPYTLIYRKDLTNLSKEDVSKTYSQTVRRNLRTAAKYDLKLVEILKNDLGSVLENFQDSNHKNRIETKNLEYYENFYSIMGGISKFYGVEFDGRIISAGIFVESGDEFIYFEGGSLQEFRKTQAATFLQHEMILKAISKGLTKYNFYGIAGGIDNGVLRFKSGFRGDVVEFAGEYRKVFRKNQVVRKIKTLISKS